MQNNDKNVKKVLYMFAVLNELGDNMFSGENDPKNMIAEFHANIDE